MRMAPAGAILSTWLHDTPAKTLAAVPFPLSNRHAVAGFALGARDAIAPTPVRSLDDHTGSNPAALLDHDARSALFLDAHGRRTDAHVNVDLSKLDGSCACDPRRQGRGCEHGGRRRHR